MAKKVEKYSRNADFKVGSESSNCHESFGKARTIAAEAFEDANFLLSRVARGGGEKVAA